LEVHKIIILTFTVSFVNRDLDKRYQEKSILILHPMRKRMISKKVAQILVVGKQQQQQQKDGFSIVSTDESFFFYDSLVKRV
jgi:hypothetical protein